MCHNIYWRNEYLVFWSSLCFVLCSLLSVHFIWMVDPRVLRSSFFKCTNFIHPNHSWNAWLDELIPFKHTISSKIFNIYLWHFDFPCIWRSSNKNTPKTSAFTSSHDIYEYWELLLILLSRLLNNCEHKGIAQSKQPSFFSGKKNTFCKHIFWHEITVVQTGHK